MAQSLMGCLPCCFRLRMGSPADLRNVDAAINDVIEKDENEFDERHNQHHVILTQKTMPPDAIRPVIDDGDACAMYLSIRNRAVNRHFDGSIPVDDFMSRVEMQLWSHGFSGENSIGKSPPPLETPLNALLA